MPVSERTPPGLHAAWVVLLLLTTGFFMSQAFRTVAAIMAPPLQAQMQLTPSQLGLFAAAYHFAFGGLQLVMGLALDLYGVRRTVLLVSPLMIVGSVLSALAPNFGVLVAGQVLIGIGCAPAFLVCAVFIARHFPAHRYAAVSSIILAVGSLGMLLTGTPLAWLIARASWRAGFWALALLSLLAWILIAWRVHEPASGQPVRRESAAQALRTFVSLFRVRHTWGIMSLAFVTYGSFIALRGLWMGPLMTDRHGWDLVATGNLVVVVTVIALISLPLFGRADPGARRRRRLMLGGAVVSALLLLVMALGWSTRADVVMMLLFAAISGYVTLQYPDVKDAYDPAVMGRAFALFTMALFMGVALVQWLTGLIASAALAYGVDPFGPVFGCIAGLLVLGALGFIWLPQPPALARGSAG